MKRRKSAARKRRRRRGGVGQGRSGDSKRKGETAMTNEKSSPVDFEVLRDLLLLVGRELPWGHFNVWSECDRRAVEKWAIACHLRASDNAVRIPREPQVAQVLRCSEAA